MEKLIVVGLVCDIYILYGVNQGDGEAVTLIPGFWKESCFRKFGPAWLHIVHVHTQGRPNA